MATQPLPFPGKLSNTDHARRVKYGGCERRRTIVDDLWHCMTVEHESFWASVYPTFMRRDMTKDELRRLVAKGLTETRGNYRMLVTLFNLPPQDHKRFMGFLTQHDCHLPFREFRASPTAEQ